MIIIDAKNMVAGRLASETAKLLLKGERISIINAESGVISGNPVHVKTLFTERVARGDPYHGPFFPKQPDRILKRIIRGMLPYKKPLGREAFKRLRVYISTPHELKGKETFKLAGSKELECKQTTIGEISLKIGGKKTWQ